MTEHVERATGGDAAPRVASGLWRRLRDVILVAERIEDFAFGPDSDDRRPALTEPETPGVALELTLRALRQAGDAVNWRILAAAAEGDRGASVEEVAALAGIPRLAANERVNELIQAGLCVRAIDSDRIVVTEAGDALVAFVVAIADDLERRATDAQRDRPGGGRGLPLL